MADKLAASQFYQNALKTTPINWNSSKGVMDNMLNHVSKIQQQANSAVAMERNSDSIRAHYHPDYAWKRLHKNLNGEDTVVTGRLDQALQGMRSYQ